MKDEKKDQAKAGRKGDAKGEPRAKGEPKGERKAEAKGEPKGEPKAERKPRPPAEPKEHKLSRLREKYQKDVVPALQKEFGYTNVNAVPKVTKVVVNMGLGDATQNAKVIDVGADELARITGQKAAVRRAKKSIAQFKVRQGMPIGAMVTLRGERMYEFLDRLMSVSLPRVRDFRGVSPKGFDGRGNYTLGLRDQLIFVEIDYLKVDKARGMNISVATSAKTDEEARKLLQWLGMPFRQT
jgi:large subunit ribosomal protein L5